MSEIRPSILQALEPVAAGVVTENAATVDRGAFPQATLDALREAGLLGLVTPIEHGGRGGSFGDAAHVVERIARSCASSAMVVCMHYAGAAVLAAHGSPEVNRAVAEGRHISTLAFSEAGSRSHFWAPVSTATRSSEGVRLDAVKSWVTTAHHATAYVWSSQPVEAGGASTIWLVPADTEGLQPVGHFDGLGLRGNDSTPIRAAGAAIPEGNRLGPDGGGFDVMMGVVLPIFNLMNGACSVGLMQGALARATAHVSGSSYEHMELGLRDLPTIRNFLARARCDADAANALWNVACDAVDAGSPDAMLRVLQVKAACADTSLEVVQACMRICGGAAFRADVAVERSFRDAQAANVMAPTSDVLYDFIGKALTGLPLF